MGTNDDLDEGDHAFFQQQKQQIMAHFDNKHKNQMQKWNKERTMYEDTIKLLKQQKQERLQILQIKEDEMKSLQEKEKEEMKELSDKISKLENKLSELSQS